MKAFINILTMIILFASCNNTELPDNAESFEESINMQTSNDLVPSTIDIAELIKTNDNQELGTDICNCNGCFVTFLNTGSSPISVHSSMSYYNSPLNIHPFSILTLEPGVPTSISLPEPDQCPFYLSFCSYGADVSQIKINITCGDGSDSHTTFTELKDPSQNGSWCTGVLFDLDCGITPVILQ